MGDASMLYVSWSQGFKSGGFSAADDGEPGDFSVAQLPPPGGFVSTVPNADFEFDDESVDAIEIGGKHEFLDGRMRLNWAAFYSEYEDLQTTIFKGVGFSVKNAASSEVQGFEVDWLMQITDSLRLGVNMAYLDATYGDFVDGPCDAIQLDQNSLCGTPVGIAQGSLNDLTGVNTLYASDWSGNAFIDYRRPLGGMELFAGVDMNYRSEFSSAGDNDPYDLIDDYTKVNARIGLGGERWEWWLTVVTSSMRLLTSKASTRQFWQVVTPALWKKVLCSVCEVPCASKYVLRKHKPAIWRAFFCPPIGGNW